LVGRIARQVVGDFEPADLALRPDVQQGLDRLRGVAGGGADIDTLRVGGGAPGQRGAACAAGMPGGFGGGTGSGRGAARPRKGRERRGQQSDDRRSVGALAHTAMAVERLDGGCGDTVAYLATETAAA